MEQPTFLQLETLASLQIVFSAYFFAIKPIFGHTRFCVSFLNAVSFQSTIAKFSSKNDNFVSYN